MNVVHKNKKIDPLRSRHSLFYLTSSNKYKHRHRTMKTTCNVGCQFLHYRDREPSRISKKQVIRLFKKNRLLKKDITQMIKNYVPRSSQLRYIIVRNLNIRNTTWCYPDVNCSKLMGRKCRTKFSAKQIRLNIPQGILGSSRDLRTPQVYKSLNHIKNTCQSALFTDIEKNPGPTYIDPSRTITAPYSQGNQVIFGETAGQQCLAMCLCALIYNKRQEICTPQDLVQVMNIGNELYLNLARLARQSFLLFSELPTQLTVFDSDYLLEYSTSYSGTVIGDSFIEGYEYCVSLNRAFDLLLAENYSTFILTIGCNAVCIYSTNDGTFKIFDSHPRDIYGNSHSQGTCVLLEATNINNVIQYVQSANSGNNCFELKAIVIREVEVTVDHTDFVGNTGSLHLASKDASETKKPDLSSLYQQCSAISLYSICYSVIKPCNYWDANTVAAVVHFGTSLYNDIGINTNLTYVNLPREVEICGTKVQVTFQAHYQGVLNNDTECKSIFDSLIKYSSESTGFLVWLAGYCISCIFVKTCKASSYSLLAYNEDASSVHYLKNISDKHTLIESIFTLANITFKEHIVMNYEIQYLFCSSELTDSTRKRIMKKHMINYRDEQMTPAQKKQKLETRRIKHKRKQMDSSLKECISEFQKKIKAGPFYICCVCNRTLYKTSVILLVKGKYSHQDYLMVQPSFDGNEYICKTCHSKLLKSKLPCQAVANNLYVDETPAPLAALEKLEQILIAQRIVFQKIVIMPKGQQRKIKGAICNVPVECNQTCNILPRPPDRSGIILLKLKRKLQFRGHVYFQAVRPQFVVAALNWLLANNPLYRNIQIDSQNISVDLTNLNCEGIDEFQLPVTGQANTLRQSANIDLLDEEAEEQDDPLNEYRSKATETCLQSILPNYPVNHENTDCDNSTGREVFNIAPGEGKHPVSLMTDKLCEELSFPVLFPKGRFGFTAERQTKLSPVKYFNARLLHYSGKFATNPEYLFFAQFITEQKKVSDSINIALKKIHGQSVTASQVKSKTTFQNLLLQNQAYLFLRQIPSSPPYWQKFMYEVVAMVKQLGIPTWFMTLSCADLRWPELFQIIAKTKGNDMTDEEVDALSYHERCEMLNLNPVIVAKHFQYRVETFFREILLSNANPIGKIVYYALRIEFQMRGSPHLHALIWTSDCPELTKDTKDAYIDYIDQHLHAYLPDKEEDPQLYDLVKTYQTHNHSKTCRKYKNVACRFNFGQFFTNRTIVAEPLAEDMDEGIRCNLLTKRQEILCKVKQKIDDVLNSSKSTFLPCATTDDIFTDIGITKEDYQWALSVSPDSDYQLHLKRPLDSCFINNYFIAGLKGFAANVDLQPVFNHYKCITYVCSYFTKDETECSQAIINAAKEAKQSNLNIRDELRKIGAAFLSTREVSC